MTSETPRILGGRYEVGELIGRGGMAEVHLGHDTRLGRTVAIKMLRADLARDSSFLTRFRREAQSAAGLSHHAIVAVYDSGEDTFIETGGAKVDIPYIVMEYVDGQTLREILNDEGKLSPDEAARITMGILSALEYSHDKGIVHRDIKPANVMLTKGGSVKVMDFGIARALADTGATMTSAQAVVGTARYLSPEQAQGETVDERSDLYSAGCVFYELMTGRTPFIGEPVSLVYQHITDTPKPPSVFEPSVPRAMDAVALHSLAKGRDERYQHAADFRADLQAARTGQPLSEAAMATLAAGGEATSVLNRQPVAPTPEPPRRDFTRDIDESTKPQRHTGLWVTAVIVALLAILGIGALVMNNNRTKEATLPTVNGQSQSIAIQNLRNAGFDNLKAVTVTNSSIPKGAVINTDPGGGNRIALSTLITVNVSSGSGLVEVPNVAGQSVADAEKELSNNGFNNYKLGNQNVSGTQYAAGQVTSTNPGGGTEQNPSTTIYLNVSNGKVQVPDGLVGMQGADAVNALAAAHLKATIVKGSPVTDPNQVNVVQSTDPQSGSSVNVNSTVTLKVGYLLVTVTPSPSPSSPSPSSPSAPPSSTPSRTESPGDN
ncbi:Stk1 family PASTA domain-containing Ser/Thr kinase [Rudaeicoccus suwonensis]|uniref:non-specific serine/threonine protein kinase n=1 Tax=Rudaeicoccus suwonensis TaxID=657409 RepID=A0A561E467_9MICO|nr:Stk1 family PASTA domain-containing Ser/Thr kinase [Rudaeicoccus suwonensis]TWE10405.1 serine/threonine-protein kinase [Rudaeicoccus suwonensis]